MRIDLMESQASMKINMWNWMANDCKIEKNNTIVGLRQFVKLKDLLYTYFQSSNFVWLDFIDKPQIQTLKI